MPRTYKKVLGPTRRLNYDEKYLMRAVAAVRFKGMKLQKASHSYGVPYSTLQRVCQNLKNNQPRNPLGGQIILSEEEEKLIVDGLVLCGEWGFPLTKLDARNVVQSYLNRLGRKTKFKENRPGPDWINSFIKRHPVLTERIAEYIKRSRAGVTQETIQKYFDSLAVSLEGIPPCCIVNYDETAFVDDVGAKKVLVKRGTRHPELIKDTSKTSISVMMAIAGCGTPLPPYVIYKSKELCSTWTENGIEGAGYNRNNSGWMGSSIFNHWFDSIILPYFKNFEGPKALIGDNCSSHLSIDVINKCAENNIKFIPLPPNTTHLTQPLDVAFFRALKIQWRDVLDKWKDTNRGNIQKSAFPELLSEVFRGLELITSRYPNRNRLVKCKKDKNCRGMNNAISGFRTCGIIPVNSSEVLKQMKKNQSQSESASKEPSPESKALCDSLTTYLDDLHKKETSNVRTRNRRLQLSPGKGIVPEMLADSESFDNPEPIVPPKKRGRPKKKLPTIDENNNNSGVDRIPRKRGRPARKNVENSTVENVQNSTVENVQNSTVENVQNSTIENVESSTVENVESSTLERIPRKRGRPARENIDNSAVDRIPGKRGRPTRENVESSTIENVESSTIDRILRKRGRPARENVDTLIVDHIPRKRGRPAKMSELK